MEKFAQNLGFRLITSSILLAFATIFVAGYIVYKRSQVAIEDSSLDMVREVAVTIAQPTAASHFEDYLRRYLTSKSGGAWLMDGNGTILASTYPRFAGAVPTDTTFGNITFRLQRGKKINRFADTKRTQTHLITPIQIISEYSEGIAEYDYLDTTRTVAFKVIPENGWLLGVEKPIGVAYSELQNIKNYVVYVCIISIIMVSVFSWLAIRKIIQPHYRDLEDLNRKLGDSVKRLSTLHKVSKSIQRILHLDEMLEESIRGIAEALGYERILLHLMDLETDTAVLRMALVEGKLTAADALPESIRELTCDKENGAIERAMAEQQPYLIRGALSSHLVNLERVKALGAMEFAVVPLIAENKCFGAITVDNPSSGRPLRDEDIETLVTFAGHVGLAVERASLHTELHNYADNVAATDALTGLYNWNHFVEWLEKQIAMSKTERKPISVIWAHADRLKTINEQFGYATGNMALKKLGAVVASTVTLGGMGARFGGGEFVIGVSSCTEDHADKIAKDLKSHAETLHVEETDLEDADLHLNVAACLHKEDESITHLLERARRLATSRQPD